MRKRMVCSLCAAAMTAGMSLSALAAASGPLSPVGPAAAPGKLERGPQGDIYEPSFEVEKFRLPEDAAALVVVEGTFGAECYVHAFEMGEDGWEKRFQVNGWLGHNGLSGNRTSGDNTTPIGVFQLNTPFGNGTALEGFPKNYLKVDGSYIWADTTNYLVQDLSVPGEHLVDYGYIYEYVLDMGYNRKAIPQKGSALFIHCKETNEDGTAGCVAIERDRMIEIMRLYGKYGDGRCYIALAPFGTFDTIYETYGTNSGLSPAAENSEEPEPASGPLGPLGRPENIP